MRRTFGGELPLAVTLDGDRRGGSFEVETNTLTLTEEQVAALRQGLYYLNVHTEANPAGEIRGQLGLGSTAPLTIVITDDPTAFAFTGFRGAGFSEARTAAAGSEGEVDVNFVHGTPDAPIVDIVVLNGTPTVLFGEVAYGEIAPYVTVPAAEYTLGVTPAGETGTVLVEFGVDLTSLGGGAATALASGLLNPSAVGGGEDQGFDLLLVLADGQTLFVQPQSISSETDRPPLAFAVEGNLPNPLNATTTLRYSLPSEAEVRVAGYDLLGRQVLATTAVTVGAGADHALALEANGLAAGTSLWRLTADSAGESFSQTGRMTVVR